MDSVVEARHSARLRLTIQLAAPRIDGLSRRFWNHPRLPEIFPEYLLTLYASMRATVPLLDGIGGDTVDGLDYALSGPGFWPNMDILRVSRRCVSGDRGRHIPIQQPTAREEV